MKSFIGPCRFHCNVMTLVSSELRSSKIVTDEIIIYLLQYNIIDLLSSSKREAEALCNARGVETHEFVFLFHFVRPCCDFIEPSAAGHEFYRRDDDDDGHPL